MSYLTFHSGLLPKNSSLDYNPVIVYRKSLILSIGYDLNFALSVSVASCHRENKSKKTWNKVKVHNALNYHKAQGAYNLFKMSTMN